MTASVLLLVVMAAPPNVDREIAHLPRPDVCELFTPLKHRFTGGRYADKVFCYRLFQPLASPSGEEYPLIVWLHGDGFVEIDGAENLGQLKWLSAIFKTADRKDYSFFLLAMQCQKDQRVWFGAPGATREDEPMTVLWEIIEKTVARCPIDEDRITLVGVSTGGTGCWEVAMRHPESFAAIAPLASSGGDVTRASLLADVPIWAFHSKFDSPEGDRQMVAAVIRTGGKAKLTEIDSNYHNCWNAAFEDFHLLVWLLDQRRGQASLAPGSLPLRVHLSDIFRTGDWMKFALILGVFVLIIVAGRREKRRRRETSLPRSDGTCSSTS